MKTTSIAWTDATWNPVSGCTQIPGAHGAPSGCTNCYAETLAERFRGTPGHYYENGFDVTLRPQRLAEPLKWDKPRLVFCSSMSDIFHDAVPDDYLSSIFDVMRAAPQHTFQVLTKRPERMRRFMQRYYALEVAYGTPIPFPNVWLGVSVCSAADVWRIGMLNETPAAIRFASLEPLLGPIDTDALDGLGWCVVGGESGARSRPMDAQWARDIIAGCRDRGIPVFFKQLGKVLAKQLGATRKGEDPAEWPDDLRVREYPREPLT